MSCFSWTLISLNLALNIPSEGIKKVYCGPLTFLHILWPSHFVRHCNFQALQTEEAKCTWLVMLSALTSQTQRKRDEKVQSEKKSFSSSSLSFQFDWCQSRFLCPENIDIWLYVLRVVLRNINVLLNVFKNEIQEWAVCCRHDKIKGCFLNISTRGAESLYISVFLCIIHPVILV